MKPVYTLLFFIISTSVFAQDCLPWEHYRVITVRNESNTNLSNHQTKILLDTKSWADSGKTQVNGNDIRFFSAGCTPVHFWSDSIGRNDQTEIWLKIPNLPAKSSVNIQVYYGDTAATQGINGDSTFIFFDDFNASSVDLNKWETVGGYSRFDIEDSTLHYASTSMNPGPRFKFMRSKLSFTEQVMIDIVADRSNSDGWGFSSADSTLERILFRSSAFGVDTLAQVAFMDDTTNNGVQVEGEYPRLGFTQNTLYHASLTAEVNDVDHLLVSRFANTSLGTENTNDYELMNAEMSGFHFILSTFGPSPIRLGLIYVRQPESDSLVVSLGEEKDIENTTSINVVESSAVKVYPNPVANTLFIEGRDLRSSNLEVHTIDGKTVIRDELVNGSGNVDVSMLESGIYIITLTDATGRLLLSSRIAVIE
ncbi:DUF2341 domain-containing protein [bacterium]|nr:DUF2341 domain-containing protein [bacterium]